MSIVRLIGILLIVCGTSGFGFGAAYQLKRTIRQLTALDSALQLMECELRFTHPPLPALCRTVSKSADGPIKQLFENLSNLLGDRTTRNTETAMQKAIENTKHLSLSGRAVFALLELGETLGQFDLQGQLTMLASVRKRLETEIAALSREQKQRCKTYEALGICAGIAVAILIL